MLYDYKNEELIQDIVVPCMCPIIEDICDQYDRMSRYREVRMYVDTWLGLYIIEQLLDLDEYNFYVCDASDYDDVNNYDEMLIIICSDGAIGFENAHHSDGKLVVSYDNADLVYVYDSFTPKDVRYICDGVESVLVFGLEDEEEFYDKIANETDPDNYTAIAYSEDHDIHGFTSKTTTEHGVIERSFVSSIPLTKEQLEKLIAEWNI